MCIFPFFSFSSCLRQKSKCFFHLSKWNSFYPVAPAKGLGFILGCSLFLHIYLIHHQVVSVLHSADRLSLLHCYLGYQADCLLLFVLHSHLNEPKNLETLTCIIRTEKKSFLAFPVVASKALIKLVSLSNATFSIVSSFTLTSFCTPLYQVLFLNVFLGFPWIAGALAGPSSMTLVKVVPHITLVISYMTLFVSFMALSTV